MSNYQITTKNHILRIKGDTDQITIKDHKEKVLLRNYSITGLIKLTEQKK